MKISIIGAGRIGLPLATFLATGPNEVTVYDIDESRIKLLNNSKIPFFEPGLKLDNVHFKELKEATGKFDFTFICYGPESPSEIDSFVTNILEQFRDIKGTLVLIETVLPGTCRRISKMMSRDVAFVPDRAIVGKSVKEQKQLPKIVGATSKKTRLEVATFFRNMGCKVVEVSSAEIAETCKLIDNCYRLLNIGFTCEVQKYCNGYGVDTNEVIAAANVSYSRNHLFEPGLGSYGSGHQKAASFFVSEIQGLSLTDRTLRSNDDTLFEMIETVIRKRPNKIAILGTAFKGRPPTDDTRNSPALTMIPYLEMRLSNAIITTFDPHAYSTSRSIEECVKYADVVIVLTNSKAFVMKLSDLAKMIMNKKALVIDPWYVITEDDHSLEVER